MNKNIYIIAILSVLLAGCSGAKPKLGIDSLKLMPCPSSPNCVSTQAKDKEHFVNPIMVESTSLQIKERILKILSELNQSKVITTKENYIRAEFTSKIFGFVDDVEFYFPHTKSKKTTIHIRSASRIGYSDLGANKKRIEEIRTKFKAYN